MCCGSNSQDVLCPGDNVPVFFFCLFVLMNLVERAGVSVLVGFELEASFSKTKILPFPTLLSALERNGSFFPFI